MKKAEDIRHELALARQRETLFRVKSYPRYIWLSIQESKFYQRLLNFWVNFRRYRLISNIIRILATVLTITGTGAALLLFLLLCLLILPIAALLAGGTMLLGFFGRERENRKLRSEVEGQTVYLFFPGELEEHTFSVRNMKQLAARPHSAVFIISPYAWASRGAGGRGFFINARQEDEHLFLLRRHYFFFFRKLLDTQNCKRIVVIL